MKLRVYCMFMMCYPGSLNVSFSITDLFFHSCFCHNICPPIENTYVSIESGYVRLVIAVAYSTNKYECFSPHTSAVCP